MASPFLLFLAWLWVDMIASLVPWLNYWLAVILGGFLFVIAIVLPLGVVAHWFVTALPRLFQHAGWDVQPLEDVAPAEQYMVRYQYQARQRRPEFWPLLWARSAQGWYYLEITAIFAGALLIIPLYLSAVEFGFGQ